MADQKSVKSCVIYRTKKTKVGSLSRSRFCANRAQNLPGQWQTMCSHCPKFHINRFTSGGVIAERVNTTQTRHKVFPILGEASASSTSNHCIEIISKSFVVRLLRTLQVKIVSLYSSSTVASISCTEEYAAFNGPTCM